MDISEGDWAVCNKGIGRRHDDGHPGDHERKFDDYSVGLVKNIAGDVVDVWLVGPDETWTVPFQDLSPVDVTETGDRFSRKICNICHRLLPVAGFDVNQRNKHGIVRRPSCKRCRASIEKKVPKTTAARKMEKLRPKKGTPFRCPICQKRSIAGITAKVVADHDRNTGNIRDFICDSCNTGLGRFKNGENILHNALMYIERHDALAVE